MKTASSLLYTFFFFQAEDGIRDLTVTGVQTCALPICMNKAWDSDPVQIRMMGGTVPTGAAVQALKIPFVILPLVNADNNQHSFDENMRLGNYFDGVHSLVHLLAEPF